MIKSGSFSFSSAKPGVYLMALALMLSLVIAGAEKHARAETQDHNQEKIEFTILHTNDEHSALLPHSPAIDHDPQNEDDPTLGGFARLATAIEDIKEAKEDKNEPVLLFNAGDFMGGAAFGWLAPAGYSAEISLMQKMGYDAAVIGNHEYDYGPEVLGKYLLDAGYPEAHQKTNMLASNIQPPGEYLLERESLYQDQALFELDNGITVGAFGLIGKDAKEVTWDTGDIEFLDPVKTGERMVKELENSGAEVIVAITHSGISEDKELARKVDGIDVIIGGHCHTALHEPVQENNTVIVQADSLVKYLGKLELSYCPETSELKVRNQDRGTDFLVPIDSSLDPHPEIEKEVDRYTKRLNHLISDMTGGEFDDIMGTVARSDFPLSHQPPLEESTAGNFITDAMRLVTEEVTGEKVDVAIQANGSIRENIQPGTMEHSRNEISFYDITEVIGLGYGEDGYAGYPIVSTYLTGEELRRALEVAVLLKESMGDTYFLQFSGLRYDFNPADATLFTVPFLDLPLPTTRAVKNAEIFTGDGVQPAVNDSTSGEENQASKSFVSLEKDDQDLYHLVTDAYILSFLPMAGEMIPWLEITPRDKEGNPVDPEDFQELVVHNPQGRELKVWETVVKYASSQPTGEDEVPRMDDYYRETSGRINPVSGFPLAGWGALLILLLAAGVGYLVIRKKRKATANTTTYWQV